MHDDKQDLKLIMSQISYYLLRKETRVEIA